MTAIKSTSAAVEHTNRKPSNGFDPFRNLLIPEQVEPDHLVALDLPTLSPFQRSLLSLDGTVTVFIEAYTQDPVEVVRVGQYVQALPSDHAWLSAKKGEDVIVREVLLKGAKSNHLYGHAVSLTVPARLPKSLRVQMEAEGSSLGRILTENHVEQWREIIWFGREGVQDRESLPPALRQFQVTDFLSRAYRIFIAGRPSILINERFPLSHVP